MNSRHGLNRQPSIASPCRLYTHPYSSASLSNASADSFQSEASNPHTNLNEHEKQQTLLAELYELLSHEDVRNNMNRSLKRRVQKVIDEASMPLDITPNCVLKERNDLQINNKMQKLSQESREGSQNYRIKAIGMENSKPSKAIAQKSTKSVSKTASLMSTINLTNKSLRREPGYKGQPDKPQESQSRVSRIKNPAKFASEEKARPRSTANCKAKSKELRKSTQKSIQGRKDKLKTISQAECFLKQKLGTNDAQNRGRVKTQFQTKQGVQLGDRVRIRISTEPAEEGNSSKEGRGLGETQKHLGEIVQKQKRLQAEQLELQQWAREMKEKVEMERQRIEEIELSIIACSKRLSESESSSVHLENKKTNTRKRLEDTWNEVKFLNQSIEETLQQNVSVGESLREERELVTMYKQVIEELKSQLKIEKSDRNSVRKKLQIIKKQEEAQRVKSGNADRKSQLMIGEIKRSLQKWR